MFLDFLFEVFRANARAEAVIWRDQSFSYGELLTRTEHWRSYLQKNDVTNGTVVAIDADFSPNAIALMLALIESGCIVVPLTASVAAKKSNFMKAVLIDKVSNNTTVVKFILRGPEVTTKVYLALGKL